MAFKKKNKEKKEVVKKQKAPKSPASRGNFLILLGGLCLLASLGIFGMVLYSFITA